MSTHDDPRRSIAAWLEKEAADRAPTRLVEASRARVRATTQRRAWWPARRTAPVNTFARLAATVATIALVGVVGLTLLRGPAAGPAASTPPTASPSVNPPSAAPGSDVEQVIANGFLQAFAETADGTLLTVWDACENDFDTDCGIAWRLGTGSQPQASGLLSRADVHPEPIPAGDGFILTPPSGSGTGTRIDRDGTTAPLDLVCGEPGWSTPTEPGRFAWTAGLSFVDTVAGTMCSTGTLGGRPLAQGVFTADGTLWALVDNETDPDGALTIGRYDGTAWTYHDFATPSGSWTSVLAAAGPNVVVLLANPEPSSSPRPDRLVGLAVSTDGGATWSDVADPAVIARDLPFASVLSPDDQDWYSGYTSMAFAGPATLYVADRNGDLWRSSDLATFTEVAVPGTVAGLQSTGDGVIARFAAEGTCTAAAGCRLNDLVRISADGSVEPIAVR